MKQFNELINLLHEQPLPAPTDLAPPSPAPGAGEQPDASPGGAPEPSQVEPLSPAAEVTLVRLLLKALVINVEDSDLSTLSKLDQPEISQENAEQVKSDIVSIINNQQTRGNNEERIDTIHDAMMGINENNRKSKLNQFIQVMKKYTDTEINT